MGSLNSIGLIEKSCVVSLRNGSGDREDDGPFDDFSLAMVLVILEVDWEILEGDEDTIIAEGCELEDHKNTI